MTDQEAIKRIKEHIAIHKYRESHAIHIVEALEMAISALQAQNVPDTNVGDMVSRRAAIEAFEDTTFTKNEIVRRLSELPSAQPEPCEDAVSRQAVIDAARKVHDIFEGEYDTRTPYGVIFDVQDAVCKLPSVQPEQRWIPCSERLPEVGKEVLVCYDFKCHRSVYIANFYGDGKFHGYDDEYLTPEGRKHRKAVAWMPLPESYRGKEGEKQ